MVLIFKIILIGCLGWAQSETSRLKDFLEHQKKQDEFEKERVDSYKDFAKSKKTYEDEMEKLRVEYLRNKPKVKAHLEDESKPEYRDYKRQKDAWDEELKAAHAEFRQKLKSKKHSDNHADMIELGLMDLEKNRVPLEKRYTNKQNAGPSGGSGSFGGGLGGGPYSTPNYNNSEPPIEEFDDEGLEPPPPPPPPSPEFDEPDMGDVPPPPPPPDF